MGSLNDCYESILMITTLSLLILVIFFQNFFRLSPGFCFADGLASLALLRQGMKDKSSDEVFDWNVTGASICYLGFEVHIYLHCLS